MGFNERGTSLESSPALRRSFDQERALSGARGMGDEVRERYSNDVFFAGASRDPRMPVVPEHVFYAGRERPAPDVDLLARATRTPLRFATLLFLAGWTGILFQAGFLQQVVFGAPVFEELAKFGPPLVVATLLRARSNWVRLPLAWASGAAFGWMEHYVTYPDEPVEVFVERMVFHGAATGLSMLVYGALEPLMDARARWGSTLPATVFHWAFNFGGIVLALVSVFLHVSERFAFGYAVLVSSLLVVVTLWGVLDRRGFEARTRRLFEAAIPRLGLKGAGTALAPAR